MEEKAGVAMKILKGRIWISIIAVLILILFGWVVWQNARALFFIDTTETSTVMLNGEYSLDGGELNKIDNEKPVDQHFKKAVFRGKLIDDLDAYSIMNVFSKNVWYTLYDEKGNELRSYQPLVSNTPGYYVNQVNIEDILSSAKGDVTLEVECPYGLSPESFSDCFSVTLSESEGIYLRFFVDALPSIIMFLLVCFFGVFFFPIASGLLGRIDFRYVAFGGLCFFAGAYMVVGNFSGFMNLWVLDPALCMMTDKLAGYFFIISCIIYFRSLLKNKAAKITATSLATAFFAMMVICVVLQMTKTADMITTARIMNFAVMISVAVAIILLCAEIKGKRNFELVNHLISWIPLCASLIIDIADIWLPIPGVAFLRFGLAITIIYQMIRFGMDFRRQYKEAIRYQQVQRELYEAKVSVMTSQIRPHFMYNALTSIAMMCEIDPKTAKQATITFAKYLRGNMDSLKQTAPVPFEQELEHLKKYLYIEKLRFDDLLNIEYDIQATDFSLPLLSVQPLVENAVKHGVGMKEDGGTVKISTRETETAYEVIIEDDGVGFDVNEQKDDGRTHVGMENTKKRLRDMCGGEVRIESVVGEGTTATVILPKEGQPNENTLS